MSTCFTDELTLLEHIPRRNDPKHLKIHVYDLCGRLYTQGTYLQKTFAKTRKTGRKAAAATCKSSAEHMDCILQRTKPLKCLPRTSLLKQNDMV
uniref:Uncharacterized protein n=1 Tax=Glossina pallidipes TaxID=7398 RepID=A0A1A9ZW25_GLOPL